MPVSFSKPDPHTVIIHGGPVRLHFARMQVGQFAEFDTMFMAIAGGRLTPVRPDLTTPSADELRTRLLEDATDARKHADWMAGVIGEYVTVASGDLTVDGEVVTSGQRFVEVMAGHPDVLNEVLVSLWLAHKLTAEQKKNLAVTARFRDWLDFRVKDGNSWKETGDSCRECRRRRLCASRGCDGVVQRRVVWHDGPRAVLRVCPVLFLTPEADYVLAVFRRCYAKVVVGFGGLMWQRVALPDGGSVREQDAWLLDALDYVRDVQNTMIAEAVKRTPKTRETNKATTCE